MIYGNAAKLHHVIKGQDGFVLINVEEKGDSEERREEELMKAITHCVTVVYSNLTILLSHKKNQKKGGSLPQSMEGTAVDEEQIRYSTCSFPEYYTGNTVARGGDEGGLYDRLPPLHFSKLGLKFYHQN